MSIVDSQRLLERGASNEKTGCLLEKGHFLRTSVNNIIYGTLEGETSFKTSHLRTLNVVRIVF